MESLIPSNLSAIKPSYCDTVYLHPNWECRRPDWVTNLIVGSTLQLTTLMTGPSLVLVPSTLYGAFKINFVMLLLPVYT